MNENSRIHYQTSFRAISDNDRHTAAQTLRNIVYGWLLTKEKDRLLRRERNAFYHKCDWRNLFITHSSLATNTYYSDDEECWALRYSHLDGELKRRRYWYIDIGIREVKETGEAIFYTKISYARDEYDLRADELPTPSSNTPRFIRDILKANSGVKIHSQTDDFGLYSRPVPFKLTYGQDLAKLIESENRRYALVVFNGASDEMALEAKELAWDLAGKAQVITLDQDPEFAEELRHFLKKDLWVHHGTFRVFFPLRTKHFKPERHRWFNITDSDYAEQRQGLLNSLLRNYNLLEEGAVKNISEIGRMISRRNLLENIRSGENTEQALEEFFDEYSKLEEEKAAIEQERDYYLDEHAIMEAELGTAKSKLEALEYHQSQQQPSMQLCYRANLAAYPQSLEEIVRLKSEALVDRVVFAREAIESAKDYTACKSLDRAWEMLYHIGTTLYDLKFNSDETGDIARLFRERSGYEYAKTEGQNTKSDSKLKQSRIVEYDGREFGMWAHIIYGNTEPKMLRIYFAYDDEKKLIVVGYVGPHMDNATSRKKR